MWGFSLCWFRGQRTVRRRASATNSAKGHLRGRVEENIMNAFRSLVVTAAAAGLLGAASAAPAQVSVGVNIGPAPICPYGYFDYPPYDCAPYGYYGPDWFLNGIFIGVGPWFHGPHGFYGHVDNRYDPRHGYHGPLPERGAEPFNHFHGNEARDGQGHVGNAGHDAAREHQPGVQGGYRNGGGAQRGDRDRGGHGR
jgi:hypothetical protein